jgi:pyruvate/2-oxoacid:ferredoxin oxidoreductase alpha subunit
MKSINLIQLKNKTPFKEAKFNKNKKKLKATIVILKRKINSTERE